MGALICNDHPDEVSGVHEFSTMNRQDGTFLNLYLREKPAKTALLYLIFNSLSFALGFESIGPLISAL
jgi:hypothetical protein